jgi:hypothetical protein
MIARLRLFLGCDFSLDLTSLPSHRGAFFNGH